MEPIIKREGQTKYKRYKFSPYLQKSSPLLQSLESGTDHKKVTWDHFCKEYNV